MPTLTDPNAPRVSEGGQSTPSPYKAEDARWKNYEVTTRKVASSDRPKSIANERPATPAKYEKVKPERVIPSPADPVYDQHVPKWSIGKSVATAMKAGALAANPLAAISYASGKMADLDIKRMEQQAKKNTSTPALDMSGWSDWDKKKYGDGRWMGDGKSADGYRPTPGAKIQDWTWPSGETGYAVDNGVGSSLFESKNAAQAFIDSGRKSAPKEESPDWKSTGASLSKPDQARLGKLKGIYNGSDNPQIKQAIALLASPNADPGSIRKATAFLFKNGIDIRNV
jgi:hypothetical protein